MKIKIKLVVSMLLMFFLQAAFAQQKISGVVTDSNNLPIPGVNVSVKGTRLGIQTDFDGKFNVSAKTGDVLEFSFIGMKNLEMAASSGMKVKMTDDSQKLETVLVTALGIAKSKKTLGYSAQKLDASDVNQTPTNNFINNLSGKVAGLEVRRNSNFGGSSNIVLRGTKSLTGNNQALMVLDGVPISNDNLNSNSAKTGREGIDFGNSASDIDPNNIESITVLKGAAATALYGSQASNGAIMITTKKGKANTGLGITFSSTTSIGMYDKKTFPEYQNLYGEGYAGENSSFTGVNVFGNNNATVASTGDDAAYGNAFDGSPVYQWNAFIPGNPNFGKATPWVAAKNDPGTFFENSLNAVNSINLSGGDDKSTFNLGLTNNYETGILPNSKLNKNNINGNFSRKLSEKLRVTAFINFTDQNTTGRNNLGYGNNFVTGFRQWWPVNVDVQELKQEYFRTQQNVSWNIANPLSGDNTPIYWNNPYFERYKNVTTDSRTRIITGSTLSYDINKNFNTLGRVTVETSNDKQEKRLAIGTVPAEFGVTAETIGSGYDLYTRNFLQTTYEFITTYNLKISDKFDVKLLGGTSLLNANVNSFEASTTGGLNAPGLYTLANSKVFVAPLTDKFEYSKFGVYGQISIDYNKILYLDATYRRDNTTALSPGNDTYGYYSVSSSFVFSDLIKADWLSLGKLRASYAEVGNDPLYGTIGKKLNNGLVGNNPTFGNSAVYVDFKNLKPENQKSIEFGFESSMFNRRLNFDISVYKTNTFNQIFNVPQSTATGFSSSQLNAGELQNKGIEIAVSGYPIKTNNFQWMIGVNWSKNKNELIKLDEGRTNLRLAAFQDGVSLNATVGEPYGTLRGTDFVYDVNGRKTVDASGNYLIATDKVIGNIQADYIAGITNKFTYKNVSFNFLIDVKKGGSVFSLDQDYGLYTGVYKETAGLNDLGNPVRSPLTSGSNSGGIILDGVFANGSSNNVRIDATTAGGAFGNGTAPNKAFIYDASYVKLREIGITYSVPSKYLNNTGLKSVSFSALGNNLWIIQKNLPYSDPEAGNSSGNIQGYQSGVLPSVKVYSFNVKVSF